MKEYLRVLIIYNPNAMKGKIEQKLPYIKERLSLRYKVVDAKTSPDENGTEKLAYDNAENYDIIVSCGGDGTLKEVINGVVKKGAETIVGVLPFGTCNDVARTLHIPFKLNKAIDAILRLDFCKYDLMFEGKDYSTYTIATGYLTSTSYETKSKLKRKFGRFAYILSGIKNFFNFKAFPLTATINGERVHGKFIYFMLVNGESVAGNRINKKENLNNGKVKLVMIKKTNFFANFFTFVGMFMFGIKHIAKRKCAIVRDADKVIIENHSNVPFTFDGEKATFLKKEIIVETKLNIIRNKN